MTGDQVTARVGHTLYWAGCALAALVALFGTYLYSAFGHSRKDGPYVFGVFLAMAAILWCIGRLSKRVLTGQ
jgi:uncharacterized membrane-anchored protein